MHCARIPEVISQSHPVLSGVPQGTALGPLLFFMIIDIDKETYPSSKLVSFVDDTRVYSCNNDIENVTNSKSILILYMTGIMYTICF